VADGAHASGAGPRGPLGVGLAVDAARALRVPVFAAPAAQQLYRLASSHGLGRKDFTSVYTLLKPSPEEAPV
jgi:hypothetical protein